MLKQVLAVVCVSASVAAAAPEQARKPSGTNKMVFEITATADTVYTGTMEMTVKGGKVTGSMRITSPTEITGKVAGTAEKGMLNLEFPYIMVEENCEGTVRMDLKLSEKPGHAAGTMEATGCGADAADVVTGTVELKPPAPKDVK